MNKSLLKFITDFGPLLIFFVVYSKSGKNLSAAIPPLIVATIIAVLITKEPVLKKMLGKSISLTDEGWKALTIRWTLFFFALALLNEYVWRTQTEEFWVNFKVWGILPITFIFTAFQMFLINRHKI